MLRPLAIVVDNGGVIHRADGGRGGFLDYQAHELAGRSVFDFVAADQHDELAQYFFESMNENIDAASLPVPFRLDVVDRDGLTHPVDIIPSGQVIDGVIDAWVALLVPVHLNTSLSRSLDAEMSGAPRSEVRRMLTEELVIENSAFSTRWFLVDLHPAATGGTITVTTSRDQDAPAAAALTDAVTTWQPWTALAPKQCTPFTLADLPGPLQTIAHQRNWSRFAVTPVFVDGQIVAAYLLFSRIPDGFDAMDFKANVLKRIERLVEVTQLLYSRWNDRDSLAIAATSDPLTGLVNRYVLTDALDDAASTSTLLFLDLDEFKAVNDEFGHEVGDSVLVKVADRIAAACRPGDVVARFGGDEFVVLLDGADTATANEVGQRIMAAVAGPLDLGVGPTSVQVSVGLAPVDEQSTSDALSAADRAMLSAKRLGRGRLVSVAD